MEQRLQTEEVSEAYQARVTPEEFARALAALEEQRLAEAQPKDDGKMPVGVLVDELGVEFSPDEVLAEVERQRAESGATQETVSETSADLSQQAQLTNRYLRQFYAQMTGMVLLMGLLAVGFYIARSQTQAVTQLPAWTHPSNSMPNPFVPTRLLPPLNQRQLVPLSAIPDGHRVNGSLQITRYLLQDGSPKRAHLIDGVPHRPVSLRYGARRNGSVYYANWTILRHGSKAYVRGWVASNRLPSMGARARLTLYAVPPGAATGDSEGGTRVTVPAGGVTVRSSGAVQGANEAKVVLDNVVLDDHATEPW
jgi:hypothetical protein